MTELLLNSETYVFDVIQDYLNSNRPFHMEKILPYIQARIAKSPLNINTEGLRTILFSLIKKKLIVEGSKFSKEKVLENSTRKKIYVYIVDKNGVLFNRLVKKLNLSNYVVYWHIKILLRFGFIQKQMMINHFVFFDSKLNQKDLKKKHLLSKKISKRIIEYLNDNDYGVTKNKIATGLEIHKQTIGKYLNYLKEVKVVINEKISNKNLYFLRDRYS